MFHEHTTSLPCAACRYGWKGGDFDDLDWCDDCRHFHTEVDCPEIIDEGSKEGGGWYLHTPGPTFTIFDKDDPGRAGQIR